MRYPVFDGHNDTLTQMYHPKSGSSRSFFEESNAGHIDLPRAKRGGLSGGFFAIFVPSVSVPGAERIETEDGFEVPMAEPVEHEYALQFTIDVAANLFRLETESQGQLKVVRTVDEVTWCLSHEVLAVVWHIEGAEAIDPAGHALRLFYQAGLRSLGLTWSRPNAFAHGVPFRMPSSPDTGPGLTPAGKALVSTCNELGIMVDLAHLNERGFWDVAETTDAPLVSTHTAANALSRTARNLTDGQIDAIGQTRGVIGVNFHVGDLRPDGKKDPATPLEETVRHVDYVVERIGVDHVAFGSDFDGAMISDELGDASGLPRLIDRLSAAGYDEAALTKITHANWVRVLQDTWK